MAVTLSSTAYYIITAVMVLGVLIGISMMSKVKTARLGNALSAFCSVIAILVTMNQNEILSAPVIWIAIAVGAILSLICAAKVKMIQMPQIVAFLNGLGGLSSALVAILSVMQAQKEDLFSKYVAVLALVIGFVTFTGSMVAAGKLAKLLNQRPVVWKGHTAIVVVTLIATVAAGIAGVELDSTLLYIVTALLSSFFGVAFAIRVGGADMPITISLLNSLSGVAGGIAGIAVSDLMLVAVGGIVGASGLLLTQVMCRAMNRKLSGILFGAAAKPSKPSAAPAPKAPAAPKAAKAPASPKAADPGEILTNAKKVMIVPGYGMALAQAQAQVKQLADKLEARGCEVKFAIHPVAGRMPGHMNVLLCEVDVPYDQLYEMDAINGEFKDCDAAVIIGASDVVNPAANTAEGTPIYGMPVLNAGEAKHVIVCNYDDKPGYAGVPNPLYKQANTIMLLGDAKGTLNKLLDSIGKTGSAASAVEPAQAEQTAVTPGAILAGAKKVMIVPGYGMALAQAQRLVKQLADKLEAKGCEVKFAIHPVAGRMPGHMNVLLCEVDVPYDQLYEMDAINDEFKDCDAAVIIGASDVVNPAANTAEGTPIYGMPVLNAGEAKHVIVCNYDDKPGYAGVPNPLYQQANTMMLLGDAKDTLNKLLSEMDQAKAAPVAAAPAAAKAADPSAILAKAKKVMIVPGYGMALAQAQRLVKQLADKLEAKGCEVKFAIHPVAGRMPGHMNVLLCEVDVPYDQLYEMDAINDEFKDCDAAVIIGASDVVNPAANTAEGTPIYGMPVLNAGEAKHVIVCNYDDKPGYAGVPNPLYTQENTIMLLGDAKDTLNKLLAGF